MLTQKLLCEVAFNLLSSSSASRFIHMSQLGAAKANIPIANLSELKEVTDRARELFAALTSSDERNENEAELAVLLATIGKVDLPDVRALVDRVAESQEASARWVSALAGHFKTRRIVSTSEGQMLLTLPSYSFMNLPASVA